MKTDIDERLKKLGITLPAAAAPAANYVPFVQTGKKHARVAFGVAALPLNAAVEIDAVMDVA